MSDSPDDDVNDVPVDDAQDAHDDDVNTTLMMTPLILLPVRGLHL